MGLRISSIQSCTTLRVGNDRAIHLHKNGGYTHVPADFIVNPAKPDLMGGGGLDQVVHNAGGPAIKAACRHISKKHGERCPTGEARITKAGNLPHTAVIHTVGPKIKKKVYGPEERKLAAAYANSLQLANQYCSYVENPKGRHPWWLSKVQSSHEGELRAKLQRGLKVAITFPSISTGSYSFPANKAAEIAIKTLVKKLRLGGYVKEIHITCIKEAKDFERAMRNAK